MIVQLKPLTAVVADALAHTFFNARHMATIHYENGHYHLHNELKEIAGQENGITKEKPGSPAKANENICHLIVHKLNFGFITDSSPGQKINKDDQGVMSGHYRIKSPPPKVI